MIFFILILCVSARDRVPEKPAHHEAYDKKAFKLRDKVNLLTESQLENMKDDKGRDIYIDESGGELISTMFAGMFYVPHCENDEGIDACGAKLECVVSEMGKDFQYCVLKSDSKEQWRDCYNIRSYCVPKDLKKEGQKCAWKALGESECGLGLRCGFRSGQCKKEGERRK